MGFLVTQKVTFSKYFKLANDVIIQLGAHSSNKDGYYPL